MATPPWCSRALPSSLVRATVRRDRQRGGRPALRPSIALGLYGHSDRRSLRPSQPNPPYNPPPPLPPPPAPRPGAPAGRPPAQQPVQMGAGGGVLQRHLVALEGFGGGKGGQRGLMKAAQD